MGCISPALSSLDYASLRARTQRTRSIFHDDLSQDSSLDSSRKPARIEALTNLAIGNATPLRNTQWLTPWP